jgi:hypothetical protein
VFEKAELVSAALSRCPLLALSGHCVDTRLNDFPNPTLDALLTLLGTMVIVAVIYLFSR